MSQYDMLLRRARDIVSRPFRTKRTVVWECPTYLRGTYVHESYDMVRNTDLVETVIDMLPHLERESGMLSRTLICADIRITAVW